MPVATLNVNVHEMNLYDPTHSWEGYLTDLQKVAVLVTPLMVHEENAPKTNSAGLNPSDSCTVLRNSKNKDEGSLHPSLSYVGGSSKSKP